MPPRRAHTLFSLFLAAWCLLFTPAVIGAVIPLQEVGEVIRDRIAPEPAEVVCRGELLCGSAVLPEFYAQRNYESAWFTAWGLQPLVADLVEAIRAATAEGLQPTDYHLFNIEELLEEINQREAVDRPPALADLELLLTDAFLLYGSHLSVGRVNPETVRSEWFINSREVDLVATLSTTLVTGDIPGTINDLRPHYTAYGRLKEALQRYRALATSGGWTVIPPGPVLQEGDSDDRVATLRSRLAATGDFTVASDHSSTSDPAVTGEPAATEPDVTASFTTDLAQAVRRFQRRHGLVVDGIVGPQTLWALNVPAAARVRQVELNLERWRWLPLDFGQRYILVNIAEFELDVVADDQPMSMMRVVVGRRFRRTPVFTGTLTYLVLNPYWNVPHRIAARDILPKIQQDAGYLDRLGMRVFASWEEHAPELDPTSIDWATVTPQSFPYKLRQDPGPNNALGRIKFMFPNKFSVYLHDTPARALFAQTTRSYSSGCIRIERPIELAAYLLRDDPGWNQENLRVTLDKGVRRIVRLSHPIPVHILYWTAWVNREGTLQFRHDIYDRDTPLDQALRERPPAPSSS